MAFAFSAGNRIRAQRKTRVAGRRFDSGFGFGPGFGFGFGCGFRSGCGVGFGFCFGPVCLCTLFVAELLVGQQEIMNFECTG